MEELKKLLLQTDDEYLTGLSNKGTVKRAYKDLEQETPSILWNGEEAEVALKEAVCRIRVPLGDSVCSCPSRSVCRHLVTAVLCLRRELSMQQGAREEGRETEEGTGTANADESGCSTEHADTGSAGSAERAGLSALEEELLAVPVSRLKTACKAKGYREFLAHAEAGEMPKIEVGSVLTVRFPWGSTVVKLLSPLVYSSCTCHSRELCVHKAQAILAFQLRRGAVTLEQLKAQVRNGEEWDMEELGQAVRAVKEGIWLQLMTGLSRLSPEAEESMERLAVICHSAGLADLEHGFRSAASEYRQYFQRSAAFRTERLLERLLGLYRLACQIEETKDPETIRKLAGTFRDTYSPVPRLHLTAVGGRSFRSRNGYEGERYYFLETEQKKWYTWTDARPVFYEGARRRPAGNFEQEAAPWGLNCSRARMMELEFFLTQAKATEDGRLSVSRETKSEIAGPRNLGMKAIQEMVVWDYRSLLWKFTPGEQESGEQKANGREPLALVGASSCREGEFDPVQQRFSMKICDREGRKLSVAVNYTEEERLTIRVLERLSRRLAKREKTALVFFGIPYLEAGRLCLYPIEYFEWGTYQTDFKPSERKDMERQAGAERNVSAETVKTLERYLLEVRQILTDLFQSGLNSVQDETLSRLGRYEKESEELGLHRAGGELAALQRSLEGKRHQMQFDPGPALLSWGKLMEYLKICLEKTALDQAALDPEDISENKSLAILRTEMEFKDAGFEVENYTLNGWK